MVNNSKTKKIKTKQRKQRTRMRRRQLGGDSTIQPPDFKSNISMLSSAVMQGFNNMASNVIKKGAKLIDPTINTEKPVSDVLQETKDELKNVVNVLNSPVGDELVQEASVIGEKMVDAVEKPLQDMGDRGLSYIQKQIPVVEDMAKTTLFGLPVIGSAAAAAEDAFDVVQSIENTVEAGSDIIQHGEKMLGNLQQPVAEASQLYSKYKDALNTNISVPMPELNLNKMATNKMSEVVGQPYKDLNTNYNKMNQNIRKTQNIGKMIGGRTRKSQEEFFAPFIKTSKIINTIGGSRTRRIRNKRRVL
jgi:hypothetical protein